MKPQKTIQTPYRFFYLNAYAFLLLFVGGGIGCLIFFVHPLWLRLILGVFCLLCLYESSRIFGSWHDKKRKYNVLMQRNAQGLRPETFREYMNAPCGRLLVRIVLTDMQRQEEYAGLLSLRRSWRENLKDGCNPRKTVIYIPKPDVAGVDKNE